MKIYFDLPLFDAQLLRALSPEPFGAADLGECLAAASRIHAGDFASWFQEWFQLAEKVRSDAERSEGRGHLISAYYCYLRACNYYRTAMQFLYGEPVDDRLIKAYDFHTQTFSKALLLSSLNSQPVNIPFEHTSIPAYFFRSGKGSDSPTLTINGGYDGTMQECFLTTGFAALQRGYNVLIFDGPGQGEMLIRKKIPMRPDWDAVLYSVMNRLLSFKEVNASKIVLLGLSWGGFLAPRGCCEEHRFAALAAIPGQYDVLHSLQRLPASFLAHLKEGNTSELKEYLPVLMRDQNIASKLRAKMWVHGVHDPVALLMEWLSYNMEGIADRIKCPSLIVDQENEHLSKGQAKELFDALACQKEYILMKNSDGAGEHCSAGALMQLHQKVFDWLDDILKKTPKHLQELRDSLQE